MNIGNIKLIGRVGVEVMTDDGYKSVLALDNLIMDYAYARIVDFLFGVAATCTIGKIAIGSSGTAATSTQINLLGTKSTLVEGLKTRGSNYVEVVSEFLAGNFTGGIQECGLFTMDGKMFARVVVPLLAKDSMQAIKVTWRVTVG